MSRVSKIFRFPYVLWWLPVTAIIVFFYPVLFGGKLIFGVAHGIAEDLPIHYWFGEALSRGTWGINHLFFGGVPSYLSQMDLLHPIPFLFYKLLKPLNAYYWLITLSFIGQWYGFYILARKLKISFLSSCFGSFVWIFNQWNIQLGGLEAVGLFLVWVPVLFFLVIKISEWGQYRFWYALLAAVILAPNWVFSLTQTTLYLATALMLFAIFLDFKKNKLNPSKYKNTFIWLTIILLSVIIVLPILRADYAIYSLSFRNGGLSYAQSLSDYYNVFDLIHFVSPFLIFSRINTEFIHFYFGILPLIFVILAWTARDKSLHIKFFQWMAILALATAIKYSPIFYVLVKLPFFNLFRGPEKFLFLFSLAAAVLSAFGLDKLKDRDGLRSLSRITPFYKKFLVCAGLILVAINLAYYLVFDATVRLGFKIFMRFGYIKTLQREPAYYLDKIKDLIGSWFYQLSLLNVEVWLSIVTLLLSWLLLYLLLKNKVSVTLFSILAIALTYFSSLFIWHRYYSFVSVDILKPTPIIKYLMEHKDYRYRVLSFNLGIETYKKLGLDYKNSDKHFKFDVAVFRTDEFMFYGIETVNGHEAFLTNRQLFFTDFYSQFATQKLTPEEKKKLFESNLSLISMMNVKYILSSLPLDKPFIKRFESTITDTQIPLYIYENPAAFKKIYFTKSVTYLEENLSDDIVKQKMLEVSDFKEKTLVECSDCNELAGDDLGTVDYDSYRPDEIILSTQSSNDSWLVFSNSFLPGWKAFIDDREVRLRRANYLFQAIEVPSGKHKVVFKYRIL